MCVHSSKRKGASPIVATTLLVAVSIVACITLGTFYGEMVSTNRNYTTLEIISAVSSISKTIENAKWQIDITIKNSGTEIIYIDKMSVTNFPVSQFGLNPVDSLDNPLSIGTNVSKESLVLKPGETTTVIIWIGAEFFSSGTNVEIKFLNINSTDILKNVVLV